jgi:hypothetical protein
MLFELLSARIKHTRKIQEKRKNTGASHTTFKVRFQRDQIKYGLSGTGSGLLKDIVQSSYKNKDQFLYTQAMKQLFES